MMQYAAIYLLSSSFAIGTCYQLNGNGNFTHQILITCLGESTITYVHKVYKALCGSSRSCVKSEVSLSDVTWDIIDSTEDYKVENEKNVGV